MIRVLSQLRPLALSLLPDYHLAVVGGAREDVAEFGVRPGDLPNGPIVAAEYGGQSWGDEWEGHVWVYPRSVSRRRWFSRSTSKILMVLSEEQVCVKSV